MYCYCNNEPIDLVDSDGEDAFVDAVRYEKLDKPIPVFNFEVEEFHTYYVGTDCVLVHNTCGTERRKAVRQAWKIEKEAVQNGTSSYNWTPAQKRELLTTGRVRGYYGHHIVSISADASLAADPKNIYFCTYREHLWQHFGNWRTATTKLRDR